MYNFYSEVRPATVATVAPTSQMISSSALVTGTPAKPDNATDDEYSNIDCIRKSVLPMEKGC